MNTNRILAVVSCLAYSGVVLRHKTKVLNADIVGNLNVSMQDWILH